MCFVDEHVIYSLQIPLNDVSDEDVFFELS